jgi:hypothetical protein
VLVGGGDIDNQKKPAEADHPRTIFEDYARQRLLAAPNTTGAVPKRGARHSAHNRALTTLALNDVFDLILGNLV